MQLKRIFIAYSVTAALAAISGIAAASGFALIEQSASGLGNAYAGGAAGAEDASTIFFNPAGMSLLSGKQVTVAVNAIKPSAKFSDSTSVAASLQTKGGQGSDAGSLALVPNAYFAMEINPKLRFGLGINAPFGLKTEYDANWMGRFQAIKSKIETVNLNPSLSYQANDSVSLGAGVSYQRINGDLTSAVNWAAVTFAAAGGGAGGLAAAGAANAAGQGEGLTTVNGSDAAWGYNFGLLFKVAPQTRVGLAYRSAIKYNLNGSISLSNKPTALVVGAPLSTGIALAYPDGPVNLAIQMPDTFSVSVFHQLNGKTDAMADLTRTGWGSFQQLVVQRLGPGLPISAVQENWRNTWRASVGASHHYNEQWTARVGLAYDQTPTSDTFRTARIPDADRTWLSVGGQYKLAKKSVLDFGYAHLFVNNAPINQTVAGAGTLNGTYSNSVDILSAQYTCSF